MNHWMWDTYGKVEERVYDHGNGWQEIDMPCVYTFHYDGRVLSLKKDCLGDYSFVQHEISVAKHMGGWNHIWKMGRPSSWRIRLSKKNFFLLELTRDFNMLAEAVNANPDNFESVTI
jgi:hypothetical protein